MERITTLDQIILGQDAEILHLNAPEEIRARWMALGFIPGSRVSAVLESPWGDPVAYEACGAVIALRRADAHMIEVRIR